MAGRLEGRVALVTGAGQGIGQGIALALAREGADVVVNDIVSSQAQGTAGQVNDFGQRSLAVEADVSDSAQVIGMVEQALAVFGSIDILVNNAGVVFPAFITDLTEEMWDTTIAVNLRSMFLCSKFVIPTMIENNHGKIVNMSSKSGKRGGLWLSAYCASKFGIIGFTQSLAMDLAPHGINVNAICPGTVYTPLWDNVLKHQYAKKLNIDPEQVRDYYSAKVPLGREVSMEEIGELAVFLCSDESDYMTGQAINISGGQEMS